MSFTLILRSSVVIGTFLYIFSFGTKTAYATQFIQGRRLHATPYGPRVQPDLPSSVPVSELTEAAFANRGGPPEVLGVWVADAYTGIILPSGFVSTVFQPDLDNEWMQQMGRYIAYSCTGLEDGQYMALVTRRDTYSNGTIVTKNHCEIGQTTLQENGNAVFGFYSSVEMCANPATIDLGMDIYRVPNSTIPEVGGYTCKKGGTAKGTDTYGEPALDDLDLKTINLGTSLPPPLDENSDFPPTFSNPGAPEELVGIWVQEPDDGNVVSAELVSKNGFSYVSTTPDEGFFGVIARLNSYNKTDQDNSYVASISYFTTNEDGTTSSGLGCTAGRINLQENRYYWIAANEDKCPDLSDSTEKITTMYRAFNSTVLK